MKHLIHVRQGLAATTVVTLLAGAIVPMVNQAKRNLSVPTGFGESLPPTPAGEPLVNPLRIGSEKSLFRSGGSGYASPAPVHASGHSPRTARAAVPAAPPAPRLTDLAADLQVSGILNEGSEAVITNKKSGETVYVRAGQRIGELVVTDVNASGIRLSYEGQTLNLAL